MSVAQTSTLTSEDALVWLQQAWQRCAGLSAAGRKKAFGICVAYQLRGKTLTQAMTMLDSWLQKLTGHVSVPSTAQPAQTIDASLSGGARLVADPHLLVRLQNVLTLLGGAIAEGAGLEEAVSELERSAQNVAEQVYAMADKKRFMNMPVSDVLGVIDARVRHADEASKHAVQEAFDRLLKSLDPAAAKDQIGEKGLRIGPFHKAAMYDAVCEKYAQMSEYHEKGRLVRDFRAMYKTQLAELAKNEGSVE